jgi:voltage-gated potassium channel
MARDRDRSGDTASQLLGSPSQSLVRALTFVAIVFVGGVIGFVVAGWSLGDAAYMVLLTIFSVGYGEIHPINTTALRLLTMAVILLGCTGMIVLTGALVQFLTQLQLNRLLGTDRMKARIDKLTGHAIICGYGRIGEQLASELSAAGQGFVIVERNPAKLTAAQAAGYNCLIADATNEDALLEAGIARARVLASVLPDDAANVFITLSARNLNRELEIIARGELPSTESKLVHAGANKVVLPTHIGAERIAEMILYPTTARFLDQAPTMRDLKRGLHEFGLELEAGQVPANGMLTGASVGEAEQRGNGGFFIVQIDRGGGQSFVHPRDDVRIEAGDTVILVLRGSKVAAGAIFTAPKSAVKMGRSYLSDG